MKILGIGRQDAIEAVREDALVGHGTCSVIDEAYTDDELWEVIKGAKTARGARSLARRVHNVASERSLGGSSGTIPEVVWKELLEVEQGLSPENLSSDGEATVGQIRERRAILEAKRELLVKMAGRPVLEEEVWEHFFPSK